MGLEDSEAQEFKMPCIVCRRASCASWLHSREEQDRYSDVIEMEEKIAELRRKIKERQQEIESEDSEE